MFLEATLKNNPMLIDIAAKFHKAGLIEPNTYVIDLDVVSKNAELIFEAGKKFDIDLYFMTKQFGRNPVIAKAIMNAGIKKAVAVDMDEARVLFNHGVKIGHLGHLVQIPKRFIKEALSMKPEVITCFSLDKVKEVSDAAREIRTVQNILLRVVDDDDCFYPGQEGGIKMDALENTAKDIKKLDNVNVVGVTSFPCFLYDEISEKIEPTHNIYTLIDAAERLKNLGFKITQINGPSATCVSSIPLLKELGVTCGEPGHAFTGTTPLHVKALEPEKSAIVYVTEVSHVDGNRAYVFGGGFYPRSKMKKAYIPDQKRLLDVEELPPESIDYYSAVITDECNLHVGDTAIYSFRTQIFVTRSKVAVVKGIQSGNPKLLGVFNSLGDEISK
ncbi:putative amino acid racemase [Tepidanaerobacter acetatoxydans Re1]|uniref:Putative amino acid racemase n=1 Tax=Tepidanaerobacter acetatoxydans (strain DSM 21804 / JCM 16047 / Re1) TaxID=1209989 RepID=F4LR01_TEPAE|nr:YhfX family PLP-dependent enzyme [Tepidanaerobacter acetatoxydans]AEE92154.1 alanine racemase domain protein [Tepidanaerobacter acetatoxydans Re1]CCP27012.1 putative amino acid racemase [Tepidanaerobacter acetatoxydans Re1]